MVILGPNWATIFVYQPRRGLYHVFYMIYTGIFGRTGR